MATMLFFHNATPSLSGTLPASRQGTTITINWTATGATTLKTMSQSNGTAQASHAGLSAAQTTAQTGFLGMFVSSPLFGAQTVGGGAMSFYAAEQVSNTIAAFFINSLS